MFFATWFILNIAHTHKRPVKQIDGGIISRVFLSLFHGNTGLRSLFNKPCTRFYRVRLIIYIYISSAALLRGRPDGVVVNTSALESRGRGFKSRSGQFLGFSLCVCLFFL